METQEIDFGRIAFVFEGTWIPNKTYARLSTVFYEGDGCGYVAKVENTNIIPGSDYNVWMKIVQKGDKGDKGDEPVIGVETSGDDMYITVDGERVKSGNTALSFRGPKGDKGDKWTFSELTTAQKNELKGATGTSAGFGVPTASVNSGTGTPSVSVTASGPDTAKVFNFAFSNLKGAKGDTGATPTITAKRSGSAYYWAVNNSFVLDGNGNKIPAIGVDTTILDSATRQFSGPTSSVQSPKEGDTCLSPQVTVINPTGTTFNLMPYLGDIIKISVPILDEQLPITPVIPDINLVIVQGDTVASDIINDRLPVTFKFSNAENLYLQAMSLSDVRIEITSETNFTKYIYLDGAWVDTHMLTHQAPIALTVSDITTLTDAQVEALNVGDSVLVNDTVNNTSQLYTLTYYGQPEGIGAMYKVLQCMRFEKLDDAPWAVPSVSVVTYLHNGDWGLAHNTYNEIGKLVTELSIDSTDDEYPSAKCVYDAIAQAGSAAANDSTITIVMNGATVDTFTTNAASNKTINLGTVITNVSGYQSTSNLVTSISNSSTNVQYPSAKCVYDKLATKEDKSNKVTSLSSNSTDTQYPSAKCVYDIVGNIETLLAAL